MKHYIQSRPSRCNSSQNGTRCRVNLLLRTNDGTTTLGVFCVDCQWSLATIETQVSHECQNIASAIVINFEECNITLLETKILRESHVDDETIISRLEEIRTHSRSKQSMLHRQISQRQLFNPNACRLQSLLSSFVDNYLLVLLDHLIMADVDAIRCNLRRY